MQLKTLKIAGDNPGKHLLIVAGVHGDEFEPMAAVRHLAKVLLASDLTGTITLIPVANESAFWRGNRCGEDGLDLARTCPGNAEGTVTQQTASALSKLIESADFLIDLHTGGNAMRLFPLSGYTLHPNEKVLSVQRRMAHAFNMPLIWGTNPSLNGRTLSVARDHNIPAIYAEWQGGGDCQKQGVNDYMEGCLNVMGELGMLTRNAPKSRVESIVEEDTQGSGVLTAEHLAPFGGLFETAVELGDTVKTGSLVGTVSDVLGQNVATIKAANSGKVICLRAFARVLEGDSLCHVLAEQS